MLFVLVGLIAELPNGKGRFALFLSKMFFKEGGGMIRRKGWLISGFVAVLPCCSGLRQKLCFIASAPDRAIQFAIAIVIAKALITHCP